MNAAIPIEWDKRISAPRMADGRLLREQGYIDGQWTEASDAATFEVRDPCTGGLLARVARLGADDATRAIDAAAHAFAGWKARTPQDRAAPLKAWSDLMRAAREDLALLMTLEQGKPLTESRGESTMRRRSSNGTRKRANGSTSRA